MQAQGMFCTYHLKQREKPNLATVVLYFPTVLPRPAEVLQKKTESDETRRLLGESLGEAWRRLRRLLLEEAWGKLAKAGGDYSWRNGKLAKWRKLVATKSAPTAREEKL